MTDRPIFDYAPAPESPAIVDIAPSYGLFIDGEMVDPIDGTPFKTVNPATEEVLSEVVAAGPQDVDRAVAAARAAYDGPGRRCPGATGASTCTGWPGSCRSGPASWPCSSRSTTASRSASRDVDLPLVAAHFFYYAGWADKLGYAGFGPDPRPLGVAGQVIPWNFPLLMLAWKIAPALAAGNTVVLKPAETTPLTALAFADICRQADLPPGVVNIVTGAGATRARARRAPGRRQGGLHRLDRGRPPDRPVGGRHPQEGHARAGRQGGQHRVRRRPARPGRRGDRQRHLLQPGPRVLRRQPAARAGVDRRRAARPAQAPARHPAPGRPARQEHRHRRHQLGRAARPDPRAVRHRRARGRRALVAALRPARARLLVPADGVHRRDPGPPHRPRGDLRPGAVGAHLPHPAEAVEKANNTPYGLSAGVWTEKGSRILWMAQRLRAGVVWANTFNRFDPTSPFGGYKESGYGREGGRHGLEAYLDVYPIGPDGPRLAVRKTYKLYVGGAFPPVGVGADLRGAGGRRPRSSPTPPWPPARTPATPWSPPARRSPAGRRPPPTTGARCCTGWPRCSRAAAPSSWLRSPTPRAVPDGGRRAVDAAIDRWVWYAGWSDKVAQVVGSSNPVAGVLRLLGARAHRRGGRRGPGVVPAGPGVGRRPGGRHRQHGSSWRPRPRRCPR